MAKIPRFAVFAVPAACLLVILTALLPPVRTRLKIWTTELDYLLNPPEEVVFIPQQQLDEMENSVQATLSALDATATLTPTLPGHTPTPESTAIPTQTPTPTITPTPLPDAVLIAGVEFQTQRGLWNYCGPSTLAMAISFWGDRVLREEVGTVLRGGSPTDRVDDKNVMPYEMENYVREETGLRMAVRSGGTLEILKALIAAGYPVVIEKHDTLQDIGWLGHYTLIVGYDDTAGQFTSMDSYHGEGTEYSYEVIAEDWRAFNFLFWVVYPPEEEAGVMAVLGPYANDEWATRHALDRAVEETGRMEDLALFYAWFNLGTSYVQLFDYGPASVAFDNAFAVYAQMEPADRPWRMMWYQTGPYFAYYYTGRYQDVFNLANGTLEAMNKPILEESFYWRGLAREALGDIVGAIDDLRTSVALNPNFDPGWAQLARIAP